MSVNSEIGEVPEKVRRGRIGCEAAAPPAALPNVAVLEDIVAAAWTKALRRKSLDLDADFRDLGMNSNRSMEVIHDILEATSIELPVNVFFEAPTIRRMAAAIWDGRALVAPDLVLMRPGDETAPLFLFPGGAGNLIELTDVVRALDFRGAVYGIAFSGLDGGGPFHDRFELEAARSLEIIRRAQPTGPVRLIGYSVGGITALETARMSLAQGDAPFVGLIDTPQNDHTWPYPVWLAFLARRLGQQIRGRIRRFAGPRTSHKETAARAALNPPRRGSQFTYRFRDPRDPNYPYFSPYWVAHHTPNYSRVGENACRMKGFYQPSRYDGKVSFFISSGGDYRACDPRHIWPKYLPAAEWVRVPGNHLSIMLGRNAARLAAEMSARLRRDAPPPGPAVANDR